MSASMSMAALGFASHNVDAFVRNLGAMNLRSQHGGERSSASTPVPAASRVARHRRPRQTPSMMSSTGDKGGRGESTVSYSRTTVVRQQKAMLVQTHTFGCSVMEDTTPPLIFRDGSHVIQIRTLDRLSLLADSPCHVWNLLLTFKKWGYRRLRQRA